MGNMFSTEKTQEGKNLPRTAEKKKKEARNDHLGFWSIFSRTGIYYGECEKVIQFFSQCFTSVLILTEKVLEI